MEAAIGGVRLHTIEPLDVRAPVSRSEPQASEVHRSGERRPPRSGGIEGLSFAVPDIEAAHARAAAEGLRPTPVCDFLAVAKPCRMFFLDDPDGIRVEMIEYVR